MPIQRNKKRELPNKDSIKCLSENTEHNTSLYGIGILLSLNIGLRLGEACGLKWSDIDIETGTLSVKRSVSRISTHYGHTQLIIDTPKTESSKRDIPIPARVLKILKKIKGSDDHYIISASDLPPEPEKLRNFLNIL